MYASYRPHSIWTWCFLTVRYSEYKRLKELFNNSEVGQCYGSYDAAAKTIRIKVRASRAGEVNPVPQQGNIPYVSFKALQQAGKNIVAVPGTYNPDDKTIDVVIK